MKIQHAANEATQLGGTLSYFFTSSRSPAHQRNFRSGWKSNMVYLKHFRGAWENGGQT